MRQSLSEEARELLEKLSALILQETALSDQLATLNDQHQELDERLHTLRRRDMALRAGVPFRLAARTAAELEMAFQEVLTAFDRLKTVARTWNERLQGRKSS